MHPGCRLTMRRKLLFPALLILVQVPALGQAPTAKIRQRVQWFISEAPGQWFGTSRDAIIAKLGRPANVSFRLNPNPQDSLTADTVFTMQYDSANFVIYAATTFRHEFLVEAKVTGSRYLRPPPLQLGASISRVRAYFNDSSRTNTSSLTYDCTWCEDTVQGTRVTLWFRKGRLVGVKWEYRID